MSAIFSVLPETKQYTHTRKSSVDKYLPGTWNDGPGPLEAALADVAQRRPDLMPLARFLLPRLPRARLCSNTLKTEKATSC